MTTLVMLMMLSAVNPEAVARDTVADLNSRAFERVAKRFDAKMSAALPASKLPAVWDSVTKQYGAFKNVKSVTIEKNAVLVTSAFEKNDVVISVAVDTEGKVSGLFFKLAWSPPSYAVEVVEREVTVGALKLPGTITLPKTGSNFRAVVFVHGSGPNDRDETTGPNKLFKDLAYGLASKGIASLRYEKRTRFAPTSLPAQFTMKEEVTDDVRDAVTLLTTMKEIDAKHIVVLGHSLGGWLAPRIAVDDSRVAAIAIFAGPTRPFDVVVRDQMKLLAPGNKDVEKFSAQFNDPTLAPDATVDFLGAKLPGSYVIDLRTYDAKKTVVNVKQPIFIAHGARDYQVTQPDLDGWKAATAKRTDVVIQTFAKLNHQFQQGEGPSTPAEYQKPGHVPASVITELASWVNGIK